MPVCYTFEDRVLHLRMIGDYVPGEIRERVLAALGDSNLPAGVRFLFDVSQSSALGTRTPEDLRAMAAFLARLAPKFGNRLAMLVSNPLQYGLLRIGEAYSEQGGMVARVFYNEREALEWLLSGP